MKASRILIVEDESITAMDVAMTLEIMGHIVVGITDTGEEAIAIAAREQPDLIVMDISLKGTMTGIEAFRQIQQIAAIPAIFLTGYQDLQIVRDEIGMHSEYMAKPFEPEDLLAAIERITGQDVSASG